MSSPINSVRVFMTPLARPVLLSSADFHPSSAPFRHSTGNLILLPYFLFLITFHIALISWSPPPHFLSFFGPHLLRLPQTSSGFPGPQAFSFSTPKVNGRRHSLKWEAVGHGAWERAFVPPQYLRTGCEAPIAAERRQSFFFRRTGIVLFFGGGIGLEIEELQQLRYRRLWTVDSVQDDLLLVFSRFRFPKYINLTSATDLWKRKTPGRISSTDITTKIHTVER